MTWFRHKDTSPSPPTAERRAKVAKLEDAEQRIETVEVRADRVAESLLSRLRQNGFTEGIAITFHPHGRGKV